MTVGLQHLLNYNLNFTTGSLFFRPDLSAVSWQAQYFLGFLWELAYTK
jgi:uncharacterized metal-binding protein